MKLKEIENLENFTVNDKITTINNEILETTLIEKVNWIELDANFKYLKDIKTLEVEGQVEFSIQTKDSRTGEEIEYKNKIDWIDQYSFDSIYNPDANIVMNNEFVIDNYVIEQINMNIPVNLSLKYDKINKSGSGWILLSEDQYDNDLDDILDPRWEILEEFKNKK